MCNFSIDRFVTSESEASMAGVTADTILKHYLILSFDNRLD